QHFLDVLKEAENITDWRFIGVSTTTNISILKAKALAGLSLISWRRRDFDAAKSYADQAEQEAEFIGKGSKPYTEVDYLYVLYARLCVQLERQNADEMRVLQEDLDKSQGLHNTKFANIDLQTLFRAGKLAHDSNNAEIIKYL